MGEQDTHKPLLKDTMNTYVKHDVADPFAMTTPGLEAELQAHIGRQLRAVYDEVVHEPVPERFLKLLEDLERKQASKS
jgi:hypothetical protein